MRRSKHQTGFNTEREGPQSLATQRFHVLLTLFSKFFASFAHATCALSVLWQYLALRQVYGAVRAAIPNNPTRGCDQRDNTPGTPWNGAFTLRGVSFQRDFPAPESIYRSTHTPQRKILADRKAPVDPVLLQGWAVPCSLAATKGIIVIFFSSAY